MKMIAAQLLVEEKRVEAALEQARTMLGKAEGRFILDLTPVSRLAARDLRSLEALAAVADEKSVRIVLRGVGSSVYKVLKLTKLSSRFGFAD